jgi:hypothetical protein
VWTDTLVPIIDTLDDPTAIELSEPSKEGDTHAFKGRYTDNVVPKGSVRRKVMLDCVLLFLGRPGAEGIDKEGHLLDCKRVY